jgi:outer membrane protein
LILAFSAGTVAQTPSVEASKGWNGTAGAGAMVFPKYVGGKSSQIWPIPILSINYDETFYVELERVGVYLLASDDKKIGLGLALEPRFGYSAKDGARLGGMATRRDSLEGGPTFDWDFDVIAFSVAWFGDLNRSSRGASVRAAVYKPLLKDAHWEIGALLALDRINGKLADYYFGVRPNEATPARATYRPGPASNPSLGFSGTYNFNKHHALMFGGSMARLGGSARNSPIAESSRSSMVYFGYGWTL